MISVVIPAYNEGQRIKACLTAVLHQTYSGPFEVLVVDNNSTDDTAQIVRQFGTVKLLKQSVQGRGAARALGFEQAAGEIICSTDADTIVPSDWIQQLAAGFDEPEFVAVSGSCRINDCPRHVRAIFNFLQPQFMRAYRIFFGHYWLTGSNCALRSEAYHRAGGFDLKVKDLEDIELGFRLARQGRIKFRPNISVVTSGHRFERGLAHGLLPYVRAFVARFWLKREYDRD